MNGNSSLTGPLTHSTAADPLAPAASTAPWIAATTPAATALAQVNVTGGTLALNPGTPAEAVAAVSGDLDLVLCMTVNPGWGGQPFIETSPDKLRRLRELVPDAVILEVDGGIGPETAARCADAGASLFVAGSAVFGAEYPGAAVRAIASRI